VAVAAVARLLRRLDLVASLDSLSGQSDQPLLDACRKIKATGKPPSTAWGYSERW